jgi:hypothetical protein
VNWLPTMETLWPSQNFKNSRPRVLELGDLGDSVTAPALEVPAFCS